MSLVRRQKEESSEREMLQGTLEKSAVNSDVFPKLFRRHHVPEHGSLMSADDLWVG